MELLLGVGQCPRDAQLSGVMEIPADSPGDYHKEFFCKFLHPLDVGVNSQEESTNELFNGSVLCALFYCSRVINLLTSP